MDFNVPLTTDVGYNRPVETPSAIGAIANIIGGSIREPRQPTKDELFSSRVRDLTSKDPAFRSSDPAIRNAAYLKATPAYLSAYPEDASEWKGMTEALGVKVEISPLDKAKDLQQQVLEKYVTSTVSGQIAQTTAMQEASASGTFNEQLYMRRLLESQAKYTSNLLEVEELNANNAEASAYFDKAKVPAQERVIGLLASTNETIQAVARGGSVPLPEELAEIGAKIGITEVNRGNINAFMQGARATIANQIRSEIVAGFVEAGADPDIFDQGPSKEFIDYMMAPYDSIVKATESDFATFSGQITAENLRKNQEFLEYVDANDKILGAALRAAQSVPSALASEFWANMNIEDGKIAELVKGFGTSKIPQADKDSFIADMSKGDAETTATVSAKALETGQLEGSEFTSTLQMFFAGQARARSNEELGKDTYEKIITKNATQIVEQAAADPVFSSTISKNILADIRKSLEAANEDASGSGLKIELIDGKLRISEKVPDTLGGRFKQNFSVGVNVPARVNAALGGFPTLEVAMQNSESFLALSAKIDSLSQLGDVGQEVLGALNLTNDPNFPVEPDASTVDMGDANITVNPDMNPLIDSLEGASSRVVEGADVRMKGLLSGPFQRMQQAFGGALVINDAIAKDGTSRESETPNSRHFHGDAIDISTAGMSDEEKMRLVDSALAAGFQGFGFGNNILHVDLGSRRAWAYGNDTFGGMSVAELKAKIRDGKVSAPTLAAGGKVSGTETLNTPEVDDSEAAPTQFERLDQAPASNATADLMADPMATEDTGTPSSVQAPAASATSAAPAVTKEGQALLASLGGKVDKTYKNAAEFQAATAVGDLEAGDIVSVNGELYFIRKDGTPQKVGG